MTMESRTLVDAINKGADLETVKRLIENGAAINDRHYFEYPLDAAVDANNAELVKFLLKYVNYDLTETSDGRNKTVLHRACQNTNPNPEIVKAILEYGIDVNYVDDYGETALHRACLSRNKEIVQLLIEYGIDINYVDERSDCCSSAIYYAISEETTEIFELLLEHGAQILLVTTSNNSVYSAAKFAPETAKLILKYIVNLSSDIEICWNDLSLAIFNKNFKLMKQLIENGQEIDMLCTYAAVVSENKELWEFVWNHASSDLVSKDLYFMIHVFDNYNYNDPLEKLWTILNKDGVNLHFERCGKAFAFFIDRTAANVFENVSGEEQRTLLQILFNRDLRINESEFERIVSSMHYLISSELLSNIFNIFLPKVSRFAFLKSCENYLDKILLPFCLEADLDVLFEADGFDWSLENIQYYLGRFTVADQDGPIYFNQTFYCNIDRELVEQIKRMVESSKFKSLVELSRDAVRKHLRGICKDSRQMLLIFDHLNLPRGIRDIIQCKVPVNRLEPQ